ncbi:hypothetical protein C2845_PM05G21560 [Panicum miliaceum]|uniref:Uncharacterized protein n=1 Tax=Panicum miliaceum TaxID=4540 RepID=A0A3L6SVF4_PANMI|nr:hypothetical protein C2845_PM05G21560 [Panicum miliaceum]
MLLEEGRSRRCATLRSRRVCQKRVPARHHAEVVVGRERERPHVGKERVPALLEEGRVRRGGRRRRRDGGGVRAFLRLMAAAFAAALPATAQPAHHLILRGRGLCSAPLGHPVPRSGPGPSPGPNHDQDPQLVGSGRRPPCPCSDSLISSPCLLWFMWCFSSSPLISCALGHYHLISAPLSLVYAVLHCCPA